ncbi:MAG: SDR family oxidoreductase [Bacteroidota bacterium]|nr:SDR family oxidoreductase [Bacteroidota bacterium]
MLNMYGTRVLVTGGSRGIGLASVEAFVQNGCDVVIVHFNDGAKAERECARFRSATGKKISHLDADLGTAKSARAVVENAAQLLGGLDIVHSNAGICRFTPFLELDDENWQRHCDVNLSAGFWVGQAAAKIMIQQGTGGRIIFTTSVGAFRSNSTQTHYCATKGGLHLLAQGMALELGRYNITVNCIAPGWIHTDINDAQSRDEATVAPWLKTHVARGRLGFPNDVQAAVLFFASKESDYSTGATITVDGGWNSQL